MGIDGVINRSTRCFSVHLPHLYYNRKKDKNRLEEIISGIYCIKNVLTNKKYIGLAKDIYFRWKIHKSELNANRHINRYLQFSWNKNGEENFEWFIIQEVEEEYLSDMEIYWISYYNAYYLDGGGYNLTRGGDGALGTIPTKETRKRWSKSGKERYQNIKLKWPKSEYVGVYGTHRSGIWRSVIIHKGKSINIGLFSSEIAAAYAYNLRAIEFRGDEAFLNDLDEDDIVNALEKEKIYRENIPIKQRDSLIKFRKENPGFQKGRIMPEDTKKKISESTLGVKKPNATSKYFGVCRFEKRNCWIGRILFEGKWQFGKQFKYEIEAALYYNELAQELYGWKAQLNDIPQSEIDKLWELD